MGDKGLKWDAEIDNEIKKNDDDDDDVLFCLCVYVFV